MDAHFRWPQGRADGKQAEGQGGAPEDLEYAMHRRRHAPVEQADRTAYGARNDQGIEQDLANAGAKAPNRTCAPDCEDRHGRDVHERNHDRDGDCAGDEAVAAVESLDEREGDVGVEAYSALKDRRERGPAHRRRTPAPEQQGDSGTRHACEHHHERFFPGRAVQIMAAER